jgi:AbrB family looped-hinge helix DNA binding protein
MKIAESRLTSRGQVSVPAEVRRRLGLAPGSVIEWDAEGDVILVRRGHRYSSDEVHATLFPDGPRNREQSRRSGTAYALVLQSVMRAVDTNVLVRRHNPP